MKLGDVLPPRKGAAENPKTAGIMSALEDYLRNASEQASGAIIRTADGEQMHIPLE